MRVAVLATLLAAFALSGSADALQCFHTLSSHVELEGHDHTHGGGTANDHHHEPGEVLIYEKERRNNFQSCVTAEVHLKEDHDHTHDRRLLSNVDLHLQYLWGTVSMGMPISCSNNQEDERKAIKQRVEDQLLREEPIDGVEIEIHNFNCCEDEDCNAEDGIPKPWVLQFVDLNEEHGHGHSGAGAIMVPKLFIMASAALVFVLKVLLL